MTFDEILEQVIILLKRQGRVSYPALKIRFSLDDDYLEALKAEIIEAQQLAIDEHGRVLVWVGNTEAASSSAVPPPQTPQQPIAQESQPISVEPPPTEPHTPDAERRQLTVMFCDLVDSTKLASQLDPEDYREVVREYQKVCSEVITRFDGHIAQYLGDGLLVYFGYPVAHEEDAQRAIHTGLGIVEAIANLNTRLEQDKDIRLAVRLGIHTGLVVVGEMGGESRQEQLALGETPNIAARIQGRAEPNTVVMSADTYRLVQGFFECEPLGEQDLRGVSQPIAVYRVLRESGVQSRLDVASTRGLTPLVGREQEVGLLLERWEQAKDGQGQVILLSGEAGIGKSRLVQVLKDHLANAPHTRWECRSSPYYQNTALYPITDLLQRALPWHQDDTSEQHLEKLEYLLSQYRLPLEETVPLFAPILSLAVPDDTYPPLNLSPQRQRQKTLESIVAILLELAEREPVLFILEDLHWTDPTTLEFLGLLVEQVPTASIYTLLTCRTEFQPSWSHRSYLTEITVNRLSRHQIEQIGEQVAGGKKLPEQVLDQIVEKTDGVPLFVEEMTKVLLESGHLKEIDGHHELTGQFPSFAIPTTLQDSLMARLDRLMTAKVIAQLGATIGRQFSYELLQVVSQVDEGTLQKELRRLVEAELLYQRGLPPQAIYLFKHALIVDAAYQSLLKSTRQQYHQRIAQVLEERFPNTVETQPELLAHHYTESGLNEQAVDYWYKAGQKASERSAYLEAIAHLGKGLEVINTVADAHKRTQYELKVQIALALAFHASKGQTAAELEHAYLRARELCEQLDDQPQRFRVLLGLYRCYGGRGQFQTSWECANELFRLAQRLQDAPLLLEAHMARGTLMLQDGEFLVARDHLEQAMVLYDPQDERFHAAHASVNPGVTVLSRLSWTLWFLGYPEQALDRSQETLALARRLGYNYSLAMACSFATILYQLCGDSEAMQEQMEAAMRLSSEYDIHQWKLVSAVLHKWYLASYGQDEGSVLQMQQEFTTLRATGTPLYQVWYLALLGEAYGRYRQSARGLEAVIEALALVDRNAGERCWEAELHRLKGQLLLQQSSDNTTELTVPTCSISPKSLKLLKRGHENASRGSRPTPLLASICA